MSTIEIPTRRDLPAYTYRIDLEGVTYTFSFNYNARMGKWLVSVADELGAALVSGVPIIVNWPLFARFSIAGMPPGDIAAYDSSNQSEDPGRFDLGARVKMVYRESV